MSAPEVDRDDPSWWQRLGPGQRTALVVVLVVVAVNAVLAALGGIVGGQPGGPVSSSFSTGADGFRGWSELLGRRGHDVQRLRSGLASARLTSGETLVVADPEQFDSSDAQALVRFVRAGGRLILAGRNTADLLAGLSGESVGVRSISSHSQVRPWVPTAELDGVADLRGAGRAWTSPGARLPIAGTDDGDAVVLVATVGQGRILAVADAAVFDNQHLDQADNAAFALQAVGPKARRVVFSESVHGYSTSGTSAIPSRWRWGALLLAIALLVGMWSVGTRVGPPEPSERQLRPARRRHVDAVAADLDLVTGHPSEVVEPLVRAARADLAARLGAPPDASPSVLHARAVEAGIDPTTIEALTGPVDDARAAHLVGVVAASRQQVHHGQVPTDTVPTDPSSGGTLP